jgi:hypothetical protein
MFFTIAPPIFLIWASLMNIVKCDVIKGSFWGPSGGNSCGITDEAILGGDVIALYPLSKYYGRDTVSPGPD